MSRRGLETSDTETEETLSLSYHDAMSGEDSGKDRSELYPLLCEFLVYKVFFGILG